jgi:hypothetical protein
MKYSNIFFSPPFLILIFYGIDGHDADAEMKLLS